MKRIFITAATLLIFSLPASILLAQEAPEDKDIHTVDLVEEEAPVRKFTIPDNYPRICRRFATLVSSHHLLQKPFDSTISAQAWTNYLRILDYERSFFTQADIDTFEKYRLRMSDDLKAGNLEFPIKAYELLKKRHGERLSNRCFRRTLTSQSRNLSSGSARTPPGAATRRKWTSSGASASKTTSSHAS